MFSISEAARIRAYRHEKSGIDDQAGATALEA